MLKKVIITIIWICLFFNFFNIFFWFLNNWINNFWYWLYNYSIAKANEGNIKWADYKFDPNILSPSQESYSWWFESNIKNILSKIIRMLLILLPTLAVFAIVVWWLFMILSWWKPDNANKWKLIIQMSIASIFVALFSYSIIKLIIWLLWSSSI